MSRTVLADVDGFTPIIDSVVEDVGIIAAAVFGRMWRYCQMENGVCHASLGTIADELHLSVRTVIRHSDILVSKGYLKDMTPDLRNIPHTYADTGKAGIKISVTGMTESHSGYDKLSQRGMTKSHLKKGYKKEKETYTKNEPSIEVEVVEVLERHSTREIQKAYEGCVPYKIDWAKNEGHAAKWLAENGYTPADIQDCYRALKSSDYWKSIPLSLSSLKKQIGEWKHAQTSAKVINIS